MAVELVINGVIPYLKTISAVTDVVGAGTAARIYTDILKQNATLPALTIVELRGQSFERLLGGTAGLASAVLHIYSWAATRAAANSLAEVVRLAPLQGYSGAMGTVSGDIVVNMADYRDTGIDQQLDHGGAPRYWTRGIYELFFDQD